MVAFTLLFFLLLVSVITAAAIMVSLKTVDFFDATYKFYRRMERLDEKMDEIIRLLGEARRVKPGD